MELGLGVRSEIGDLSPSAGATWPERTLKLSTKQPFLKF